MKIHVVWPDGVRGFCTNPFIQGSCNFEFDDKEKAEQALNWYKNQFPQNQYNLEE